MEAKGLAQSTSTLLYRDPSADVEPKAESGLLDAVLASSIATDPTSPTRNSQPSATSARLDQFLKQPSPWQSLADWLGLTPNTPALPSRSEITRALSRDIARIDGLVNSQINAIIHHPSYQKLEASWRGLEFLIDRIPDGGEGIKVKVLNISWPEVSNDLTRALEFDQSQLFKKIYENEFGHPGGEPLGIILGDYEMHIRPAPGHPQNDIDVLSQMAGVSAAAFAPFITSAHPSLFGLDSYGELERPFDLTSTFEQPDYIKWRSLRQLPDSRFLGLTLPRMLMRVPHGTPGAPGAGSRFKEETGGVDLDRALWGNAVYAFGAVVMRSYANSGWPADIRGVRQSSPDRAGNRICLDDGGLVAGLPSHSFATDAEGVAIRCSTEVVITDSREKTLEDLGFIPLCHCQDTEFSAFYSNQSLQKPSKSDDPKATANAKLSAMLQYILCVSRFAHYIKVMARDQVGSMIRPEDVEEKLQAWLMKYTISNDSAGPEVKAKYPLREARVHVRELAATPGTYHCEIHLKPHFQLDQIQTALKFTTELAPARSS